MSSTKSYRKLHEEVISRPGATERLAALRRETLVEIGLYEFRRAVERLGIRLQVVSVAEADDQEHVVRVRIGGEDAS